VVGDDVGLHGRSARIAALLIVAAGIPAPARAHFFLVAPDSWMSQGPFGDPQKLGPCGDEGGGTATGKVTSFRPGETIEVTIDERIHHPCGSTEIQDPPIFPILADNVLPHSEPFDGPQTFTVTLPSDVTCTRCTLQIIEYMSHHGRPCFYHHCADISIQGGLETPTPTSTPSEATPVAPTPTPTPTPEPPASCAGDCDSSGSVTVNELVTLVSVALEATPIDACEAGNGDGNQEIALNEVVAAVNRALRGCASAAR
jgi:hypothetical protein